MQAYWLSPQRLDGTDVQIPIHRQILGLLIAPHGDPLFLRPAHHLHHFATIFRLGVGQEALDEHFGFGGSGEPDAACGDQGGVTCIEGITRTGRLAVAAGKQNQTMKDPGFRLSTPTQEARPTIEKK